MLFTFCSSLRFLGIQKIFIKIFDTFWAGLPSLDKLNIERNVISRTVVKVLTQASTKINLGPLATAEYSEATVGFKIPKMTYLWIFLTVLLKIIPGQIFSMSYKYFIKKKKVLNCSTKTKYSKFRLRWTWRYQEGLFIISSFYQNSYVFQITAQISVNKTTTAQNSATRHF